MPKALKIARSRNTPNVIFDPRNNVYEISGNSLPENAYNFYKLLEDWFSSNIKQIVINNPVILNIKLEFISTSSLKAIVGVFKVLEDINFINDNCIKVNWYYEEDDEDMKETGEEYDEIIDLPFEIKLHKKY